MSEAGPPRRSLGRRIGMVAPLMIVLAIFAIFLLKLEEGGDPAVVPSALVGQAVPATDLPPLAGLDLPGIQTAGFRGQVTLLNVWGSWCGPCRQEHPALLQLAADPRIRLIGVNYKDQPGDALGFLNEMGNPYRAVGVDSSGRTAIDWGVYGVPETFVVGRDGTIRYKLVGPIGEDGLKALSAEIEKAVAAP